MPKKAPEEPKPLSLATPNPWSALPRELHVGTGHGEKEGATTESPVDGQDQPKIYTIRDHTLEVLMHPDVLELHAVRVVHTPHGDERQLHLKVRVRCGREEKVVDVLVDTGAQVSLVRRGLFKEELLQPSRRPVRLKVANGEIMGGGTHEATISMEFWEHERLNRPDQAKRSTLSGNFYVADITDWDMIMGYDFMVANAIGALPHRATLVREDDECLTWLSTDYACGSSQWNAEEEDRIVRAVQAVGAKSRGDRKVQLTEYGMAPQVYDRMIQTLGAEAPETDVFASRDAPLLRKCRRHWHRGDSAWHRHWGWKEWGPMYWHGSLDNTRRTVEKIIADRAKGFLVITGIGSTPCPLEGLKSTLDSITLNEMSFGPEEELFIDAKGVSMPSPGQAWGTKAFLVDGAQAQPTGDEAFIRRVEAVPMKVMFEPKEGTDQPIDGIDVLSHAEIDDVVNYMRMGMHDRVAAKKRRAMVTSPHWWDDKMLVTGKYEKDEFVARVMDHIADQYDGPVGSDPPTWGFPRVGTGSDEHQPEAANFRRLSVGSAPHDDEDGISDEEKSDSDPEEAYTAVRSVVSIPKQVAEEAQENPKVAELKERLIKAYPRLFSGVANKNPPDRGRFGTAKIKLKPNPKIYRHREYQLQGDRAEAMKKLLAEFIERGWIEPSDSEWASPAFIVPKKEKGEWRLVVDYRGLNEQTEHDSYSLPLIDSILQKQQKKRIFTVLDLKHGYHQMPLHPDSRPCTAMSTPLGPMQWKVVPMGAKNGNAAFQRMMEDLLGPVRDCADPFVDDIIIGSGTENMTEDELIDAHEKDLRRVLSELDKHNMVCKPTRASLFVKKVEFAGHVVGHGQRRPMPGKLASLHHWEKPQTISELRSFMGFCNYYSGYVRMYAELSGPLHKMLQVGKFDGRKGSKKKLAWTREAEDAFNSLKERLLGQLGLFLVDPDKGFVLRTDASDYALGAVLEQVRDDGTHVPVAFWSRILAEGQRRTWTAREKETYAIVCALRKWSGHIGLQPVVVCTDHQSLQSWHKEHVDTPSGPAARRARWHETFAKFDLSVVYVPGKDNTVADCLSRWAYPAGKAWMDISSHGDAEETEEAKRIIEMEKVMEQEGVKCFVVMANRTDLAKFRGARVQAIREETLEQWMVAPVELVRSVLTEDWSDDYAASEHWSKYWNAVSAPSDDEWPEGLTEDGDKLFLKDKLLVPENRVEEFIDHWHNAQLMHPGRDKMQQDLEWRFKFPPGYYAILDRYCSDCAVCRATKSPNHSTAGNPVYTAIPEAPMRSVAMDVFAMPEVTVEGETYDCVILAVDRHSGYIVAVPGKKSKKKD